MQELAWEMLEDYLASLPNPGAVWLCVSINDQEQERDSSLLLSLQFSLIEEMALFVDISLHWAG